MKSMVAWTKEGPAGRSVLKLEPAGAWHPPGNRDYCARNRQAGIYARNGLKLKWRVAPHLRTTSNVCNQQADHSTQPTNDKCPALKEKNTLQKPISPKEDILTHFGTHITTWPCLQQFTSSLLERQGGTLLIKQSHQRAQWSPRMHVKEKSGLH